MEILVCYYIICDRPFSHKGQEYPFLVLLEIFLSRPACLILVLRTNICAIPTIFFKMSLFEFEFEFYICFVSRCSCRFWLFVCWEISFFFCSNNDEKPSIVCMKVIEHLK